jgi:Domain of unknown function (DUF1843)
MATSKSKPQKGGAAKQAATKKAAPPARPVGNLNLPPYGVPIRDALARGDKKEMKAVAAAAREYVKHVQAALDKLDKALGSTKK